MRIKRLEIQGFKSFKDKTVIHFDHSITGIVGPNGCGKSNIVDAFFWVMGEQSYKHMRGSGSDDLIFNGSSRYTPLGMAEATLVMETEVIDRDSAPTGASASDEGPALKTKEISVSRRLYRSGEGEYFINGTLARLKDIQELFMDTGVGTKGYSVIEQGQIGKIVNSKPEERRLLIEEAAGIAKYKARKKESLRKMEATQANLSRLTDIIQEIEKNLGSLERQAQKARQYKKYKDELLDKEMTWGRRKSHVFKQKLETLKKQKETLEQDLIALKAELQISENAVEVDRIQLVTENKEAEMLQARIQDITENLSQKRSSLDLSRRRQGDLTSQLKSLESEKLELQTSVAADTNHLTELEEKDQEAKRLFEEASLVGQQMNSTLNVLRREVSTARSEMETTQRELMSGIAKISDLNSRASGLLSKAESARAQAERLSQQAESQNEKLATLQEELEKTGTAAKEVHALRDGLKNERKEQSVKLQDTEQEVRQMEKEKDQSLRSLTQLKSRLQSLEELDQSHEGLADGPKAVLDWAKAQGKGNTLSAFTDALEVSPGYEAVLESWLENRIEHVVLQDPALALPLLEQLKSGKQGRVSIQILLPESKQKTVKTVDSKTIQSLLEKNGFQPAGDLTHFVRCKGSFVDGVKSLISNVFVVESSAPMDAFLQSTDFGKLEGWSIVSKDGIALEPNGLIRGGSLDASGAAGILRRKNVIEELKVQVETAETQHQAKEDRTFEAKQNLELMRARLQTLQTELQSLEVQAAALDRDVLQMDRAVQEAKRHRESLESDIEEMNQEADRALQDGEEIKFQVEELISSRTESEETLSQAEKQLVEKEGVLRTQESELNSVRVKEASLRERSVSLNRELEGTKSLIRDRERRLTEIGRTLERATREQEQFSGGESLLAQEVEELTLSLASLREQLADVKDRIEQANSKVSKTLDQIKTFHKTGDQKTNDCNRVALEIEKLSGELTHLVLNLEEKYGPGCLDRPVEAPPAPIRVEGDDTPAVVAVPQRELSPEEELALGEDVERLRERIRRLGEVNIMAIEEFEQLKARYDHLLNEKGDLERSLQNLQEAIEHINKTSIDRFKKAFDAIADRFERLFPIIFGGGQAKLSLVYPEGSNDILEAGVDILAQPPGKKVANITLLSGGEKALTAVSLIFAIFMVKPSPFCILDEVDAPLDDANIGKFNALLREMSSKSQFILITHNKKTMELNDTLYGVTMEEPGVSKMVSIEMQ